VLLRKGRSPVTTTTHITASCVIAALAIKSGLGPAEKLLAVALASLASHFIIDLIPHGFIAHPDTIFKKFMPTFFELAPGPVIMLCAMAAFGSPLLFLWAAGFSIIPDVVTTLTWKGNDRIVTVPGLSLIHWLHREVHWFETDHPDGTVTYLFPNRPMLALEALLVICLLLVLFIPLRT
jgi:hypothetical protein